MKYKSENIVIPVRPEDKRMIRAYADKHNMNLAEAVRTIVLPKVKRELKK